MNLSEDDFTTLSGLAAQAQKGDTEAYSDLLRQLYPFVLMVVRTKLGAAVDADDVTQECLLAVHKSLATYHPSRRLKPWIRAIIRYKIADYFRKLSRTNEREFVEELHSVTNDDLSANRSKEGQERDEVDLDALLVGLPESLRRPLVLTRLQGLSCSEAALQEGLSEAALRKRVSRAYKWLACEISRQREGERAEG
ncbi:MAG: RNA polymerase sigma factor [Lentisphaerae bacterium]|nr:RNA polymerase sigma factor [Lentisphaerota bacterium]